MIQVPQAAGPQHDSQAVLWWRLINEAEELRVRTGWGLAGVWARIHRGEYAEARAHLDAATDRAEGSR